MTYEPPLFCYTCAYGQSMTVTVADERRTILHCRQGVPDKLRVHCKLHAPIAPEPPAAANDEEA
jgi:hypothetical protein